MLMADLDISSTDKNIVSLLGMIQNQRQKWGLIVKEEGTLEGKAYTSHSPRPKGICGIA